tara:strand:+ start:2176 stop:2718 length:543 start_codon:yes stop_codon:yes gene_type:complete
MLATVGVVTLALTSCSSYHSRDTSYTSAQKAESRSSLPANYASRLPQTMQTHGKRVVLVDPKVHAWGAYDSSGKLIKAGLATAGGYYCKDVGRACKTPAGTFRINSLGAASCKSSLYPKPNGGAPMPYCMFFNKNIGFHGSAYVMEGNQSHGCVRMKVADAEWMRYNFAKIGTKVIVKPY